MPPSYSMMLPGRMSTPLIFMGCSLLCQDLAGALAGGAAPGKQWVGIDRSPLPPAVGRPHAVDREMEVRARGIRVAGAPDRSDRIAAAHSLALVEARRIGVEMGVIIAPLPIGRADVDGDPAAAATEEQFLHDAVGRRDDRRAARGHDVDRVVDPGAARAG